MTDLTLQILILNQLKKNNKRKAIMEKENELEVHIIAMRKVYNAIQDCRGLSFHKKDLKKHYRKLWNELKDYCYFRQISFKQLCKDHYIKGV